MKMTLFPQDSAGKWSTGLSAAFVVLIWLKMQYSIHIMTFAIAALGLAGFAFGITAIIKNKDRSLFTFLSVLVGLVIIFWIAAEIIYPH